MIENPWLIYTIAFIIIAGIMFVLVWRYVRRLDKQLDQFLQDSKNQLMTHKQAAKNEASQKVYRAFNLIRKLQSIAEDLEKHVQDEYQVIIKQAHEEKEQILDDARKKAQQITQSAEDELGQYKEQRQQEIEKNLVKLVIDVTEKVVERTLSYEDHVELIQEALDEVKQKKERI